MKIIISDSIEMTPEVTPQQPLQQDMVTPPADIPQQSSQPSLSTGLNYSKKFKTYWFAINEPVPPEIGKILTDTYEYRYNARFKQYSKQITQENMEQIQNELTELQSMYNTPIDQLGIQKFNEMFTVPDDGVVEGARNIDDITDLNIDETKKQELSADYIKQQLLNLANSTDEAAKQNFIGDFLNFSTKFHKYSFLNQILMWFQNKEATDVAGAKNWENNFGRQLREGEKAMDIFAPDTKGQYIFLGSAYKLLEAMKSYAGANPPNMQDFYNPGVIEKFLAAIGAVKYPLDLFVKDLIYTKKSKNVGLAIDNLIKAIEDPKAQQYKRIWFNTIIPNRFKMVQVYDIAQTDPIPGAKKVYEPPSRDIWQSPNNTEDENTAILSNAVLKFAAEKNIKIDIEADTGEAGGWSSGSEIAISKMSQGLRRFSTTVHEIAHSLLHFGKDRREISGQQKEIEAESTSYIVLKHFGFDEPSFAANYLALHRANKDNILKAFENVSKSAGQIISGINKHLSSKKAFHYNWFKKYAKKSYTLTREEFLEITSV